MNEIDFNNKLLDLMESAMEIDEVSESEIIVEEFSLAAAVALAAAGAYLAPAGAFGGVLGAMVPNRLKSAVKSLAAKKPSAAKQMAVFFHTVVKDNKELAQRIQTAAASGKKDPNLMLLLQKEAKDKGVDFSEINKNFQDFMSDLDKQVAKDKVCRLCGGKGTVQSCDPTENDPYTPTYCGGKDPEDIKCSGCNGTGNNPSYDSVSAKNQQVAESYPMAPCTQDSDQTTISYNQTKKLGDATVSIHATAKDIEELNKVMQMAGLDTKFSGQAADPQAPGSTDCADCNAPQQLSELPTPLMMKIASKLTQG